MRAFGDFLGARIAHVGFPTVSEFQRKVGVSRPTIERMLKAKMEADVRGYRGTREAIAKALRFREWAELMEAWRADDVLAGIDEEAVTVEMKRGTFEGLRLRAEMEQMTLTQWLDHNSRAIVEFHEKDPRTQSPTAEPVDPPTRRRRRD